jgi:hypothetical protein
LAAFPRLDPSLGEALTQRRRGERALAQILAVGVVRLAQRADCGLARELAAFSQKGAEHVLVLAVLGGGAGDRGGSAEPLALPGNAPLDGPGEDRGQLRLERRRGTL